MDLRQLRYFVTIAEAGGFAAASDLLDVGQPTLSRQIRALELDLKVSLFHRHGRGVVPTEAGQRFLRHAHHVLRAAEAALSELHEEDRRLQGRVVCGLTRNVGRLTIADFAQRFHEQLPLARVGIVNQLSHLLYDQVRAGKLDFAVVHNPPPSSRLSIVPLGHQRFYLVGTRQVGPAPETVELRLLDKLPLAMPTGPHIAHPLELEAARSGIQLQTLFEVDAPDALFELVTRGCAHTVSTQLAIHSNWTSQTLVCQEIVAPRVSVNLSLVHPPLDRMTPLQKAATAIARSILSRAVDPLPASS